MRTFVPAVCLFLIGCSGVGVREARLPGIDIDGLPVADRLSNTTRDALSMLGIEGDCLRNTVACSRLVLDRPGTVREATRLLAAADLLHYGSQHGIDPQMPALDCVRYTWRYLYDEPLQGRKSALDARSQLAMRLHNACTAIVVHRSSQEVPASISWQWDVDPDRFPRAGVARVVLASTVHTSGLRTRQADDGIGVAAVAIGTSKGMPLFPGQPFALAVNVRYVRDGDTEALRVADASSHVHVTTALGEVDLARDPGTAYALSAGLFEKEVNAWAGLRRSADENVAVLRLLAPVRPDKTPVVLVHGFASSPLAWANLANELIGDPDIADHYQIWLARYPTSTPTLANRYELARRITELRNMHVANRGRAPIVLVGHSFGGVIARLLASNSGDTLWRATFAKPPGALGISPEDEALVQDVFRFDALPGVDTAVFIAAPHRGSTLADGFLARIARGLMAARPKVLGVLSRTALGHPDAVQPALRASWAAGGPTSLDTLSPMHPVSKAARDLPLAPGVMAYSIIGIADPRHPERGDGVVPLESAQWPQSIELRVHAGHSAQDHPETVTALKRILLDRLVRTGERPNLSK